MRNYYLDPFNNIACFNLYNAFDLSNYYEKSIKEYIKSSKIMKRLEALKISGDENLSRRCNSDIKEADIIKQFAFLFYPKKA